MSVRGRTWDSLAPQVPGTAGTILGRARAATHDAHSDRRYEEDVWQVV